MTYDGQYTDTVELVYYGHLGTDKRCPGYQRVLISRSFYMIKCNLVLQLRKCLDYGGVLKFQASTLTGFTVSHASTNILPYYSLLMLVPLNSAYVVC